MILTLKKLGGRAALRTVTAIASCSAGQRGLATQDKRHGLFAWEVAQAYQGLADTNRDNHLEATELSDFLLQSMAQAGAEVKGVQTPKLFLPDNRAPRLSDAAKKAIRRLAASLAPDEDRYGRGQ